MVRLGLNECPSNALGLRNQPVCRGHPRSKIDSSWAVSGQEGHHTSSLSGLAVVCWRMDEDQIILLPGTSMLTRIMSRKGLTSRSSPHSRTTVLCFKLPAVEQANQSVAVDQNQSWSRCQSLAQSRTIDLFRVISYEFQAWTGLYVFRAYPMKMQTE